MKGFINVVDSEKAVMYQAWIDKNTAAKPGKARGTCRPKAEAMAKKFPELSVVGHSYWGTGHAWCVNDVGEIVDPTAQQFGDCGYDSYHTPTLKMEDFPTHKCMWCGDDVYPDTPGAHAYLEGDDLDAGPHTRCNELMRLEYGGGPDDDADELPGDWTAPAVNNQKRVLSDAVYTQMTLF